jgi:hypothetical protein
MDFYKTIHALRQEKEKLDRVIASLEALQSSVDTAVLRKPGRGRKFMSTAERQEVSERMRRYWASKRSGRATQ